MSRIESNIFPIENINELSSSYRLYKVRGLLRNQEEYYKTRQYIQRKLSYDMQTPALIIDYEDIPHLVLREDAGEPPSSLPLVRTTVYFEAVGEIRKLDYSVRTPENDRICLRFIHFAIQSNLGGNPRLWQLGSGKPFFEIRPAHKLERILHYKGFAVRHTITPNGSIGLCVDMTSKFISAHPLPVRISRDEYRELKGKHCVYHYGNQRFEIQLAELSELNVTELLVPKDNTHIPLLEYIISESGEPVAKEVTNLPHDGSVAHYYNNRGELRAAPTGLCYPIYDTQSPEVQQNQNKMTPPPHKRYEAIKEFVSKYFQELRFGNLLLRISKSPVCIPYKMFTMPDLEFGNSQILSVRGTPGSHQVSLDNLGRVRAALLRDKNVGFYNSEPLDRQYLFLPQTVVKSFGSQFVKDLCHMVDDLFPQENGYRPIVVTYNDVGPRTFVEQGKAIISKAVECCKKSGYALVMIHHTTDRRIREEDQLAALVVNKFREFDIYAAVCHSKVATECYGLSDSEDGKPYYKVKADEQGRFSGYLRMVALNKILLTNERWPFILATPLHADVTIGIDVKNNTAGFSTVCRRGSLIRTKCSQSNQKEKLLEEQVSQALVEIIGAEANAQGKAFASVVIHRQGRIYQSEQDGIHKALDSLKNNGTLSNDAKYAVLEIGKSSLIPLRLFDVTSRYSGSAWIENPQVGYYHIANEADGYLCATGRAFPHRGTVQPLHTRYVEGNIPFEHCLEDIYYLTALAWTRPEDCSRYPITLKLTDRRLTEEASEYDSDAFEFQEIKLEGVEI